MLGALEVNLVGGEDEALHILLTIIGPILIAGAAVLAARTARDSASERQEKQLEHDSLRQELTLSHDREMREKELAHDRETRQREHARGAVDQAIEVLTEAHSALGSFQGLVEWHEEHRPAMESKLVNAVHSQSERSQAKKELAEAALELQKERIVIGEKISEMYPMVVRLRLRLGSHDAIPTAYEELIDAWEIVESRLAVAIKRNRDAEAIRESESADDAAGDCYGALMTSVEVWLQ